MDGRARKCSKAIIREGKLLLDLGNLPGDSSNEDRLQVRKKVIRPRKYFREKLLPPQ